MFGISMIRPDNYNFRGTRIGITVVENDFIEVDPQEYNSHRLKASRRWVTCMALGLTFLCKNMLDIY